MPVASMSRVFGQHNNQIASLPTDHHDCAESVFKHIRERALAAKKKAVPLLIMIFAPVTPEQDIIFDFGGSKAFLTTDKIRKVVRETLNHEDLQVTLVTPSPFTAGWMCNPSLFPRPRGTPDALIRVISKSCGAALADSLIKYHTTRKCPLLSADQRANAKYDDIMPVRRTQQQVDLFHGFHRKMHAILEQRLSPLGGNCNFNFDMDKDAWQIYDARRGMSLDEWKARWYSSTADRNVEDRIGSLGQAFGGDRASQLFHIKYLVQTELETCYGDWGKSITGGTKKLFENFVGNANPDDETAMRAFDAVEFRSSSMTMAHILTKGLGLPSPGPGEGVKCRYWRDTPLDDDIYHKLQHAFSKIQEHNIFEKVALFPGETRHEFDEVRFLRASRWLAATVATRFANGSRQEIDEFVRTRIVPFVRLIRVTQSNLLLDDPVVKQFGLEWIASIPGLGSGSGMSANTAKLDAQAQPLAGAQSPVTVNTPKTNGTSPSVVPSGPSPILEHGASAENGLFEASTLNNSGNAGKRKSPDDSDIEVAPSQKQRKVRPELKLYIVPAKRQPSQQAKGPIDMPTENIVKGPVVKVTVPPPNEERVVKPVLLTAKEAVPSSQAPFAKPVESIVQEPDAKVAVTKPGAKSFAEPIVDPANKSAMESSHKPVGNPTVEPDQRDSEGQIPAAVQALIMGSVLANTTNGGYSLANQALFSLSNTLFQELLKRHPKFVDEIMAAAVGKLNLGGDENQATTAATPSVVASGLVTTGTKAEKENGDTTSDGQVSGEVDMHGASVETSPAHAALVNPTPPQTPVNGRTIGDPAATASDSETRATPQQPSAGEARLAGPDDFFRNIKGHAKW